MIKLFFFDFDEQHENLTEKTTSVMTDDDNDVGLGLVKTCVIIMFLVELMLSLHLQYRQYLHMVSMLGVPPILRLFYNGPHPEENLDYSREYSTDKLVEYAWNKFYVISLWILIIFFDGIYAAWELANYFTFLWAPFFDPVVLGRNITFALICYTVYHLLTIPMYSRQISSKLEYRNGVDLFVQYMLNLFVALIIVGFVAGWTTWMLMLLDRASFLAKSITLIVLVCLCVILFPIIGFWNLIQETESIMKTRQRNGFRRTRNYLTLEAQLTSLCDRVGFPKKHLLILSDDSAQSTAYFFGCLGYSRIVVKQGYEAVEGDKDKGEENVELASSTNTLTPKETEAIVAHELGHWYYMHSDQILLIEHVLTISAAVLTHWLRSNQTVLEAFHLSSFSAAGGIETDNYGSNFLPGVLIAYFIILRAYKSSFKVLSHIHSQLAEQQADIYAALHLGYYKHFAKGLTKIVMAQQVVFPSSDPLYQMCYHDHPSLVQRLSVIHDLCNKKSASPKK